MKRENNTAFTYIMLFMTIIMCLYGFFSGQAEAVLTKAVNICMECIGLG
ncbi:MAG: hypothetical protein IJI05_01990 [Erysipelotrichaceae bacterium]|nr:hypothetical protein [Erysipelotrichaceae bacterium]